MFSWSYKRTSGWKSVSGIPSLQVPYTRKEVSQILTWFPRLPRWDRKYLREGFIILCLKVPLSPWKQLLQCLTSWNMLQGFDSPREDLDTVFLAWKKLICPPRMNQLSQFLVHNCLGLENLKGRIEWMTSLTNIPSLKGPLPLTELSQCCTPIP